MISGQFVYLSHSLLTIIVLSNEHLGTERFEETNIEKTDMSSACIHPSIHGALCIVNVSHLTLINAQNW